MNLLHYILWYARIHWSLNSSTEFFYIMWEYFCSHDCSSPTSHPLCRSPKSTLEGWGIFWNRLLGVQRRHIGEERKGKFHCEIINLYYSLVDNNGCHQLTLEWLSCGCGFNTHHVPLVSIWGVLYHDTFWTRKQAKHSLIWNMDTMDAIWTHFLKSGRKYIECQKNVTARLLV